MYSAISASPQANLNLSIHLQAAVGPSLLQGLNSLPYATSNPVGLQGAPDRFNPGGLGCLRPAPATGTAGGGKAEGYIRGLEDALKQVRGPKSKPDEERIRALLQTARQGSQNGTGPSCTAHSTQHLAATCGPQGVAIFQTASFSGGGPSQPQGAWQQGYTEGVQAALGQIRGKDSKPDEERVRALLQGARTAQGASPGQPAGLYSLRPPLCGPTPSLFGDCRGDLF